MNQLLLLSPTNSETPSMMTTDNLHPGYPYITHTDLDYDLPNQHYKWLYLATIINPINGDPRIISKVDREGAPYNKGELITQLVDNVEEDVEEGIGGEYGIGGDTYLDFQFLSVLGSLADQGLNAKCLCMVQAEYKKHSLERWEQNPEAWERALLTERQGYQQAKWAHNTQVADIKIQLRWVKFASCMTPLLPDCPGAPAFAFPCYVGAHIVTRNRSQARWGPCHWCGGQGLNMHRAKDCKDPHKCCWILCPGRCVVPEHHSGYWAWIITGNKCPYNGDHQGQMPWGDYAWKQDVILMEMDPTNNW